MKLPQKPETPCIDAGPFLLRKLARDDADALFPTFSDPSQCRYMSQPHFSTHADLVDWLDDSSWAGRSWSALDKTDGKVVGRFVAFPGRDDAVLELGYLTVKERQGTGVATHCMTALVDHLFASGVYRRLFLEIDRDNLGSIALAERLGFVREGLLREHETTHNGVCDLFIYGILRAEWLQVRAEGLAQG